MHCYILSCQYCGCTSAMLPFPSELIKLPVGSCLKIPCHRTSSNTQHYRLDNWQKVNLSTPKEMATICETVNLVAPSNEAFKYNKRNFRNLQNGKVVAVPAYGSVLTQWFSYKSNSTPLSQLLSLRKEVGYHSLLSFSQELIPTNTPGKTI